MEEDKTKYVQIFGLTFSLHMPKYFRLLLMVWLVLLVVLSAGVLLFQYEMTSADIPGGMVAGALLAYLIHIVKED